MTYIYLYQILRLLTQTFWRPCPRNLTPMFSDDSDVDLDDVQLTINEHYAKEYEHHKEREKLEKRTLHLRFDPPRSNF